MSEAFSTNFTIRAKMKRKNMHMKIIIAIAMNIYHEKRKKPAKT